MKQSLSLCVYCGSASPPDPVYTDITRRFARTVTTQDWRIVYGGCSIGLMGTLADAALEAGGHVTGIIPDFLTDREIMHNGLSALHVVKSMHERKALMCELSDVFVALPGGFGTLDELFEIIVWRYLKLHDKPVIILNEGGYWTKLLELADHIQHEGFAHEGHRRSFSVAHSVEELPALVRALTARPPALALIKERI